MTPTQVWEGFDAHEAPLETSIISANTRDNLVKTKQAFTVENTSGGKLRACCDVYYDDRWADARGAILILPSLRESSYMDQLTTFVKEGYLCCVLDYCGIMDGDVHTTFPQDLSYAKFPNCEEYLDKIQDNARNTVWFIWAKIARRAISMLAEQAIVDSNRIAILGLGTGAELGWIVAGIDKRTCAFVAVNGGGYRWTKGLARFAYGNVPSTDHERVFSTGVGAETYAKFITCPTLYISSQSSMYNDIDRMADMIELVNSNAEQMIISTAGGEQITSKEFSAMLRFLRNHFALNGNVITPPTIAFEEVEGRLYVRLHSGHKATQKTLYINYGEENSTYRFWECMPLTQKVGTHEYICNIPVYDKDELIVAYATFEYANGDIMSTRVIGAIPSRLDVNQIEELVIGQSRIIYDSSMGFGSFTSETKQTVLADDNLILAQGPFNITGISAKAGDISLGRNLKDTEYISPTAALHFDAYSPLQRDLEITVYTYPDLKKYTAHKSLHGGEFWQKLLIECTDFKSDEGRTLTKFTNAKVLNIIDINGVVLNNFLWI